MLYQEVRPKKFSEVRGNKRIIPLLEKVVKQKPKKRPHCIMLHGPSGCGKTTLTRILATEFGCDPQMGYMELNAANTGGVNDVREVVDGANQQPMIGECKIYVFDESHKLTPAAQEVLLKPTEDIPDYVYYIFCTTDPSKLIKTLHTRCAKYEVQALRPSEMRELIGDVCKSQKIDMDEDAIKQIAKAADGSARQGVTLLEQVMDIDNLDALEETLEILVMAETSSKDVGDICKEIITKRANRWANCQKILATLKEDPEKTRISVLNYCKAVLLSSKDLEEQLRMAELIAIFEQASYAGGMAAVVRMVFEGCFVD